MSASVEKGNKRICEVEISSARLEVPLANVGVAIAKTVYAVIL